MGALCPLIVANDKFKPEYLNILNPRAFIPNFSGVQI